MEANADSNGTIDLGASGSQFKDLYLSGGVVFGPASASTVSSQTLDSYEEGTWTPSLGGNAQYNIQAGRYRKVGAIVFVYLELRANVLGTGSTTQISGLPFSAGSSAGITPAYYDGAATAIFNLMGNLQNTTIALYGRTSAVNYASQTPAFFQDNARIYMTATYETAS
jgi:hypothetical protein